MELPPRLVRAFGRPHFWLKYLGLGIGGPGRYPEFADQVIPFAPPGRVALEIRLDAEGMNPTLFLRPANRPPIAISDRQSEAAVLRWPELEALALWDALAHRRPYPGLGVLLLAPFALFCGTDDRDSRLSKLLLTAADSPGVRANVIDSIDQFRAHRLARYVGSTRWIQDGTAWVLAQPDPPAQGRLRSRRMLGLEFPHVELLALVTDAIANSIAIVKRHATPAAVGLARQVLANEPAARAILWDALQEGCEHPTIVAALATDADPTFSASIVDALAL